VRRAYSVAVVRRAEAALMATLPAGVLMSRAAAGLATTCGRLLAGGGVYGARVVLLVGSGDNGGDALYAGERLARRGARVDAVLVSDRHHEAGLAALLRAGGRRWSADEDAPEVEQLVAAADLVVDGVLGIGGRGGLRGSAAALAGRLDEGAGWLVAADLPSGVDADTGAAAGAAVRADVTVTFGALKPGLLVGAGRERAGVVELVDLGLGPYLPDDPDLASLEAADVEAWWPYPGPDSDKYRRGVVGVVAGSASYGGAAVLCVGGAIRAGAGMVRFAGADHLAPAVQQRWPEAVVGQGRVQAWVVGPGLGTDDEAAQRVREVLRADEPVLVDADGLTVLAAHPEWARDRDGLTVLTPHDREFERFGAAVGDDRVGAARRLAAELGVVVLLKGTATVVAQPDGTAYVNPTGTGWLATAGSGDVLSGVVGALLAAGLGPMAPVVGAYVHGLAGRVAADGAPVSALQVAQAVPAAVRLLSGVDGPFADPAGR
jgi:hydroxyethylthiazole kinase-like uncharacterized protein yjeF